MTPEQWQQDQLSYSLPRQAIIFPSQDTPLHVFDGTEAAVTLKSRAIHDGLQETLPAMRSTLLNGMPAAEAA